MKNLTPSVYTFENLIKGDFLYVDKTEYLWKLVQQSQGIYFLSRPRRFGKSLTLSTLKAIFQGKRELFKGLAIDSKPYDWKQYPIIHIDFNGRLIDTTEHLEQSLQYILQEQASVNGIAMENSDSVQMFNQLIGRLSERERVVVLVDEYDKPILNSLGTEYARNILAALKPFYSVLKARDAQLRFVFVTGVTKFCHVSLFSDLNNLMDISMDADYATMLGYTQTELEANFQEWIADAESRQLQPLGHSDFLAQIKEWYDGYRFVETTESVYNPVSLASFFLNHGEFSNYWFVTGTPTFLMELIKQKRINLEQVLAEPSSAFSLSTFEIDDIPPLMLLFQTGYLTIKSWESMFGQTLYQLGFPNREVSDSFNVHLLNAYSRTTLNDVAIFSVRLSQAIVTGDLPSFQKAMEVFFAGIPYDVHRKSEANFQNVFFAIFRLLGYNVTAESRTSDGRIDAVIETDSRIYLFEFKLNQDGTALSQIKEKEYFRPHLLSGKKIILVGANFDTETGRLSDWRHEEVIA